MSTTSPPCPHLRAPLLATISPALTNCQRPRPLARPSNCVRFLGSPPLPTPAGEASGKHGGAKLEISFQDPSKRPPMPPVLLSSFNIHEMVSQNMAAFQAFLHTVSMRAVRDHPVFAANIMRYKSKHYPEGQDGIFPGSYMAFAKRGSAWELTEHHDDFVRLGFSIKVIGEIAAK